MVYERPASSNAFVRKDKKETASILAGTLRTTKLKTLLPAVPTRMMANSPKAVDNPVNKLV
jgi:hypothetical protein